MVGLIIFLIIIAALLALMEAALLAYVLRGGEFRQTSYFPRSQISSARESAD